MNETAEYVGYVNKFVNCVLQPSCEEAVRRTQSPQRYHPRKRDPNLTLRLQGECRVREINVLIVDMALPHTYPFMKIILSFIMI